MIKIESQNKWRKFRNLHQTGGNAQIKNIQRQIEKNLIAILDNEKQIEKKNQWKIMSVLKIIDEN